MPSVYGLYRVQLQPSVEPEDFEWFTLGLSAREKTDWLRLGEGPP